jgi:hypothetical protein
MKSVCDKYGALFILDEVCLSFVYFPCDKYILRQIMSGMGRTWLMTNNLPNSRYFFQEWVLCMVGSLSEMAFM